MQELTLTASFLDIMGNGFMYFIGIFMALATIVLLVKYFHSIVIFFKTGSIDEGSEGLVGFFTFLFVILLIILFFGWLSGDQY